MFIGMAGFLLSQVVSQAVPLIRCHWKTYLRLKSHYDALVQVSLHDIGRKLGFLHKLLDG